MHVSDATYSVTLNLYQISKSLDEPTHVINYVCIYFYVCVSRICYIHNLNVCMVSIFRAIFLKNKNNYNSFSKFRGLGQYPSSYTEA